MNGAQVPMGPFPLALLTISLGVVIILLAGGVVFGLPSLYPVFYQRGHWDNLCTHEEAQVCSAEQKTTKCCDAQLAQITTLSSICYFLADASAALWGEAVDRAGARRMLGLAAFIACTGALCIGLGTHHRMEGLIATALLLVALAGPGVFFSSYTG